MIEFLKVGNEYVNTRSVKVISYNKEEASYTVIVKYEGVFSKTIIKSSDDNFDYIGEFLYRKTFMPTTKKGA